MQIKCSYIDHTILDKSILGQLYQNFDYKSSDIFFSTISFSVRFSSFLVGSTSKISFKNIILFISVLT